MLGKFLEQPQQRCDTQTKKWSWVMRKRRRHYQSNHGVLKLSWHTFGVSRNEREFYRCVLYPTTAMLLWIFAQSVNQQINPKIKKKTQWWIEKKKSSPFRHTRTNQYPIPPDNYPLPRTLHRAAVIRVTIERVKPLPPNRFLFPGFSAITGVLGAFPARESVAKWIEQLGERVVRVRWPYSPLSGFCGRLCADTPD